MRRSKTLSTQKIPLQNQKNGEIQRSALHAEQLQSHLQLLALIVV